MSTKAATFSAKIRNLNEHYNNALSGQVQLVSQIGVDLNMTLRYFSNTLLSVLKEITAHNVRKKQDEEKNGHQNDDENYVAADDLMKQLNEIQDGNKLLFVHNYRIKQFSTLSYTNLYHALVNMFEIVPIIQNHQIAVGQSLINTVSCLAPFLPIDLLEQLPYTVAMALTTFPVEIHEDIMDNLCNTLLPITLSLVENPADSFVVKCIPSIIMVVLEYSNNNAFYSQLFDCLLTLKENLIQDVLCTIAYGTYQARYHATNLLLFYWPNLSVLKSDKSNTYYAFNTRKAIYCQSDRCAEKKIAANKLITDASFIMSISNNAPPLYLCNDCYREVPKIYQIFARDVMLPVEDVSLHCQNKTCTSTMKNVGMVCYSPSCVSGNSSKPLSLCKACHETVHRKENELFYKHVYQATIDTFWNCSQEMKVYLTDSIVKLLKEASAIEVKKTPEVVEERKKGSSHSSKQLLIPDSKKSASVINLAGAKNLKSGFNKRLLSRLGCHLIIKLIGTEVIPDVETFSHILSMLFQWFVKISYLPADASGELISKFRTQYAVPWIKKIVEKHYELVVCCLLPYPPEFCKIGGIWETAAELTVQFKEEFNKVYNLIPYDIITLQIWHYIMPYWLEAILNDVPEKCLIDFKPMFVKLFDPEMTPLAFSKEEMFSFITERFDGSPSPIQEQALTWLQVLCMLEVILPLDILLQTFHTGLISLQKLESRAMRREAYMSTIEQNDKSSAGKGDKGEQLHQQLYNSAFPVFDTYDAFRVHRNQLMLQQMTGQELAQLIKEEEEDFIINNTELNITCCIMMLDMVLKQLSNQKMDRCLGMYNPTSKEIMSVINKQLILPWANKHKCKQDFGFLGSDNINNPTDTSTKACSSCEECLLWLNLSKELLVYISPKQEIELPETHFNYIIEMQSSHHKVQHASYNYHYHASSFEPMQQQQKISANFEFKKASETPNGTESEDKPSSPIGGGDVNDESSQQQSVISEHMPEMGIWHTSQGTYYFKLGSLHIHLQLFYSFLKYLNQIFDIDALYNLLTCLKMLMLHGACLETAAKDQKGFLIYCLEKYLIPNLWKIIGLDFCHLSDIAVQLLLHSLVYDSGKNAFWTILEREFNSSCWKTRMQAVSRSLFLAQHLKPKSLRVNCNIYSCLAFAFSNMVNKLEDINSLICQKTLTYIETLSDSAIKSIILCFELQFDTVIADRWLVLQILYKLYAAAHRFNTQTVLTWEFFMQRFNTLSLEQQLVREQNGGEALAPVDICGVNNNSQHFQRKIYLARFALLRTCFVKQISSSLKLFQLDPVVEAQPEAKSSTEEDEKKEEKLAEQEKSPEKKADEKQDLKQAAEEHETFNKVIVRSLISTLMKFMMYDDQTTVCENRITHKHQNVVLKHLFSLMSYSHADRVFSLPPSKLRQSNEVNGFMCHIARVLDINFALGNLILPVAVQLLKQLPAPSVDHYMIIPPTKTNASTTNIQQFNPPSFTLYLLDKQNLECWLQTLFVVTFKYQYNVPANHLSESMKYLLKIVINTLDTQYHRCQLDLDNDNVFQEILRQRERKQNKKNEKEGKTVPKKKEKAAESKEEKDKDQSAEILVVEKSNKLEIKPEGPKHRFSIMDKFSNKESLHSSNNSSTKKKGFMKGLKMMGPFRKSTKVIRVLKKSRSGSNSIAETLLVNNENQKGSKLTLCASSGSLVQKNNLVKPKTKTKNNYLINLKSKLKKREKSSQSLQPDILLNFSGAATALATAAAFTTTENEHSTAGSNSNLNKSDTKPTDHVDSRMHKFHWNLTPCFRCFKQLEIYTEESLGTLLVICESIIQRECSLVAGHVLEVILSVLRLIVKQVYPWQSRATVNYYIPGHYKSVAKQFVRCVLHQLAGNEIFYHLFQSDFQAIEVLEAIAVSLHDFSELTSVAALRQVVKDINAQRCLNLDICLNILNNACVFISFLPIDTQHQQWLLVFQEFDILFKNLEGIMNNSSDYTCLFLIIINLLKVHFVSGAKSIFESFSKVLCFILRNCHFKLEHVIEICSLCVRAFTKERDRQYIPKAIINELVQGFTFKSRCLDQNMLLLVQLAVLDAGGSIYPSSLILHQIPKFDPHHVIQTGAADCLKQNINEIVTFIGDIHTITKIKTNLKQDTPVPANEDPLGSQLKAGLAQFLALDFTEINRIKDRDSRSIVKYFPWLSNIPSNPQQGPKEFLECIDHIRILSWILIGSLTHTALTRNKGTIICYPIPITCGNFIGEHVFYILNGFAEHSKTSAVHMSSLFHSFILCQLWTMYCEQIHLAYDTENDEDALKSIMEFWTRITPGILQLLSQNRVLAEMVIMHFLNLMEALQEYNSIVLARFLPMWLPVLYLTPLQTDQMKRIKQLENHEPQMDLHSKPEATYEILVKCLQRLQYKIAMIESQSSNAAQLYHH